MRPRPAVLLVALLALALGVRAMSIDAHGPWLDEIMSISSATGGSIHTPIGKAPVFTSFEFSRENTARNVLQAVVHQDGGNAVAYNLALHYWQNAFGPTDRALRALSLLAGLATVWLTYAVARRLVGPAASLLAAAIVTFHPLLVRESQELRSYSLATMFSLLATWVLVRVWQDPARGGAWNAPLYGLGAGLAVLCHYLTAPLFVGHALFAAVALRTRRGLLSLALGSLLGLALVGAWMVRGGWEGQVLIAKSNVVYEERASRQEEEFARPATARYLAAGILQDLYALTGNFLQKEGWPLRRLIPTLLVPFVLIGVSLRAARQPALRAPVGLLILLSFGGTVLAVVLAFRAGHVVSMQPVYQTFAAPYVAILMGHGTSQLLEDRRSALGAGVLWLVHGTVMACSLQAVYADAPWYRPANEYVRLAARLADAARPDDLVTYPSWVDARLCNLYYAKHSMAARQTVDATAGDDITLAREGRVLLKVPSPRRYWLTLNTRKAR